MANKNDAINSYITDMLALEEHIETALRSQLEDLKDYPAIVGKIKTIHRTVEHHISDLKQLADARGANGATGAIKRAGAVALGFAAGAIDLVRTEGLPKNLRDDYTAFSLATIGYVMLNTVGLALGERDVAELANQFFRDYTRATMTFHNIVPAAVVRYLQEEGLPAQEDVLQEVNRNIEEGWRGQSDKVPDADQTSLARGT